MLLQLLVLTVGRVPANGSLIVEQLVTAGGLASPFLMMLEPLMQMRLAFSVVLKVAAGLCVESTCISQFGALSWAPELASKAGASSVLVSRMQTGVVPCAPGVAVAAALTTIDVLPTMAMNDICTVDVAVPESESFAFCVNEAEPVLPYLAMKSPLNTAVATETCFAEVCVTPASTAASSAFCSCVWTSLAVEKSTAVPIAPMMGMAASEKMTARLPSRARPYARARSR